MFGGENDTQYVGFFFLTRFRDHLCKMPIIGSRV